MLLAAAAVLLGVGGAPGFYVLDPSDFAARFPTPADLAWAEGMVPFVDLPVGVYEDVVQAYYYRARSYRKHVSLTPHGYVVTEFLPKVPWAGMDNTIPAAAGHHILEGRWLWEETIVDDYVAFWFNASLGRSNVASYTNWILSAAYQKGLLVGRQDLLGRVFNSAAEVFRSVYTPKYLTNSTINQKTWRGARVCWRQDDGHDAMEVSISGTGCRPTIAAALFGEASVLAVVAAAVNDTSAADEFGAWARFSRDVVLQQHWNPTTEAFAVIPPPTPHPVTGAGETLLQCDIASMRPPNATVPVRELLGFMPWYYGRAAAPFDGPLIPPGEAGRYAGQFKALLESSGDKGFNAEWGLRTAPVSNACYNYSWSHGDCWNGPSWPYETSRVLTALANLLNDDFGTMARNASGMTADEFERLLLQYARQHTRTYAINDTASPPGSGHIFENLHPDLGYWNNRHIMYSSNNSNRDMGDDYNHSTFMDLVLSALFGIRAGEVGAWLAVNPLISPTTRYFAVDHVKYRGRVVSVVWDVDGTRYNKGTGLSILVDGTLAAHRATLGRLTVVTPP
eukprot:Hpha_TRINITY_DN26164_c0_g1::TRINITY_DN26164_c0_g1_i1::g.155312::m.155312